MAIRYYNPVASVRPSVCLSVCLSVPTLTSVLMTLGSPNFQGLFLVQISRSCSKMSKLPLFEGVLLMGQRSQPHCMAAQCFVVVSNFDYSGLGLSRMSITICSVSQMQQSRSQTLGPQVF